MNQQHKKIAEIIKETKEETETGTILYSFQAKKEIALKLSKYFEEEDNKQVDNIIDEIKQEFHLFFQYGSLCLKPKDKYKNFDKGLSEFWKTFKEIKNKYKKQPFIRTQFLKTAGCEE